MGIKNNYIPEIGGKEKAIMDARKKVGHVVEVHSRVNFTRCTYSSWRLQLVEHGETSVHLPYSNTCLLRLLCKDPHSL